LATAETSSIVRRNRATECIQAVTKHIQLQSNLLHHLSFAREAETMFTLSFGSDEKKAWIFFFTLLFCFTPLRPSSLVLRMTFNLLMKNGIKDQRRITGRKQRPGRIQRQTVRRGVSQTGQQQQQTSTGKNKP